MITGKSYHVTVEEFDAWFTKARIGDALIYCTGYLARDRGESGTAIDKKNRVLGKVADRAKLAAESGSARLFQRRVEAEIYDYLIVRRALHLGDIARAAAAPAGE